MPFDFGQSIVHNVPDVVLGKIRIEGVLGLPMLVAPDRIEFKSVIENLVIRCGLASNLIEEIKTRRTRASPVSILPRILREASPSPARTQSSCSF